VGDVLTGERPQVHHLRQGYFASRPELSQSILDQALEWVLDKTDNDDKQLRLSVFWIGGRSGSGKSVALMHVLALLHESGLGPILWLGNKTNLLRQAVPWTLKLATKNQQPIIGIDDPYAPNTQGDDIVWKEALAILEGVRQRGDSLGLPLIICCGPSEQAERMQRDLPEEVTVHLIELPEEDEKAIFQLRKWYVERTKKSPPGVGDENVLLVQLFFEWETGETLPEFASRFRNRIKESDPRGMLEDVVTRMLCVNRLYVGYPNAAIGAYLTPDLRDTFYRLREEHHISQTISDRGIGLWLAHPHLSNVIYESWYPLRFNQALRTDHLRRVIKDSVEFGSSASEKMAPLWALSNATFGFPKQNPTVGRLDQKTVLELLPSLYASRIQDSGERLALSELPAWIQIAALFPDVTLEPHPVNEAVNQIKVENLEERGLRLTCHKLLQHFTSLSEYQRHRVMDSIARILAQAPYWHEWAPIADGAYRKTKDQRLIELIINWVDDHPRSNWAARLFAFVFNNNSKDPRLTNAARGLLPCVGGESDWGDIAIGLLEDRERAIPLPILLWAENNHKEWGACFLLGRLLRRGLKFAIDWAIEWCAIWHNERAASYVLEPLLALAAPDERIRKWCVRWTVEHWGANTAFLVEKMITIFPLDAEVLSITFQWLENNSLNKSWSYVWSAFNKVNPRDAQAMTFQWLKNNSLNKSWSYVWSEFNKVNPRDAQVILSLKTESTLTAKTSSDSQLIHDATELGASSKATMPDHDDLAATWYSVAIAYRKAEREEEAIPALIKATELKPDFAKAWQALGAAYGTAGETDLALQALLKVTELMPNEAEAWHNVALAQGKAGHPEDQIAALKEAVQLNPRFAASWRSLAATYDQLGQIDLALETSRKLIELKPKSSEYYYLAIAQGKAGHDEAMIAALKKAIELRPRFVEAWQLLSATYARLGERELALQVNQKLVELRPDDAQAWYYLALAYSKSEHPENQIPALFKATELDPQFTRAWQRLGAVYNQIGQTTLGLQASLKLVELNADDAEAWYSLAIAYRKAERKEEAVAALRRATELKLDFAKAWQALGAASGETEQTDIALQATLKVTELMPNDAEAWHNLAIRQGKAGRYEDKIASLKKAIKLNSSFAASWRALGATCIHVGQIKLALEATQKLVELKPNIADSWYQLAIAQGNANHHKDQVASLRKAIELRPRYGKPWQLLRDTYDRLGQRELALQASQKLVELKPDDSEAWYSLAIAYRKAERKEDVIPALLKATELKPDLEKAWRALGAAYGGLGQTELALEATLRLRQLRPDDAEAID
jgi:tetratricopeptide (TPR) repeat protein